MFDVTFSVLENSVIFTLFLGLISIYIWDRLDIPVWLKAAVTVGIMYIASFGNWSYFGVLYCLIFYFFKDNASLKWILFSAVSVLYIFSVTPSNPFLMSWSIGFSAYKLGVFLAPFFLLLYNGEPGKKSFFNKWFFYIFYPGHLFVMGVIGIMIGAFIHWI